MQNTISLNTKRFCFNHICNSFRQSKRGPKNSLLFCCKGNYSWGSSAYRWKDTPYFSKIATIGCINIENKTGARIELCGIPQASGCEDELCWPMGTLKLLFVKKDWNHFNTLPYNPIHLSNLEIKILWSIISNAELKSKSTKATTFPLCFHINNI